MSVAIFISKALRERRCRICEKHIQAGTFHLKAEAYGNSISNLCPICMEKMLNEIQEKNNAQSKT